MASRITPLTCVADHLAERAAQSGRDQQDRQHLQEIGQRRGVLKRVATVGIEEPAAIGAELLDGHLRSGRSNGDGLRCCHNLSAGILVRLEQFGLPIPPPMWARRTPR